MRIGAIGAAAAVVLFGVGNGPAAGSSLIAKTMTNEPFNLAVSMTMSLASCDMSEEDHSKTGKIREAAVDVASEQLHRKRSEVNRLASKLAARAAQKMVVNGTSAASCAYHKAWLLGVE